MKSLTPSFVASLLCAVGFYAAGAHAQGIYVTPGEKGPVFSNKPQPGSKEIVLPPLTVVAPTPDAKSAPVQASPATAGERGAPAAAAGYRNFAVVWPENEGSVLANTAIFEVRVAVDPPLQIGEGHAVMVSVNGRSVAQRFTADEFTIPPEFWTDTLPPPNQRIQLDASIVDGKGQVLRRAAPVRFFMRHATVRSRPQPPISPPPVNVETRPKPPPASEGAASGSRLGR